MYCILVIMCGSDKEFVNEGGYVYKGVHSQCFQSGSCWPLLDVSGPRAGDLAARLC